MLKMARLLAAAVVATSLAACSGVSSPSSQTVDTFTGSVDPIGQSSNNFSVGKTSELSLTLISLTPRPVLGFIGAGNMASALIRGLLAQGTVSAGCVWVSSPSGPRRAFTMPPRRSSARTAPR